MHSFIDEMDDVSVQRMQLPSARKDTPVPLRQTTRTSDLPPLSSGTRAFTDLPSAFNVENPFHTLDAPSQQYGGLPAKHEQGSLSLDAMADMLNGLSLSGASPALPGRAVAAGSKTPFPSPDVKSPLVAARKPLGKVNPNSQSRHALSSLITTLEAKTGSISPLVATKRAAAAAAAQLPPLQQRAMSLPLVSSAPMTKLPKALNAFATCTKSSLPPIHDADDEEDEEIDLSLTSPVPVKAKRSSGKQVHRSRALGGDFAAFDSSNATTLDISSKPTSHTIVVPTLARAKTATTVQLQQQLGAAGQQPRLRTARSLVEVGSKRKTYTPILNPRSPMFRAPPRKAQCIAATPVLATGNDFGLAYSSSDSALAVAAAAAGEEAQADGENPQDMDLFPRRRRGGSHRRSRSTPAVGSPIVRMRVPGAAAAGGTTPPLARQGGGRHVTFVSPKNVVHGRRWAGASPGKPSASSSSSRLPTTPHPETGIRAVSNVGRDADGFAVPTREGAMPRPRAKKPAVAKKSAKDAAGFAVPGGARRRPKAAGGFAMPKSMGRGNKIGGEGFVAPKSKILRKSNAKPVVSALAKPNSLVAQTAEGPREGTPRPMRPRSRSFSSGML